MKQRIDYRKAAPEGFAAMRGLESYVRHCGLPRKLVELTLAVIAINGWNRLAIPLRAPVGDYQPGRA